MTKKSILRNLKKCFFILVYKRLNIQNVYKLPFKKTIKINLNLLNGSYYKMVGNLLPFIDFVILISNEKVDLIF